ncbi:N-acetyltransferase B complex non catalytic subunit-domain-containing protein [Microdochium trichocladiopsis]|uniref:N-acetyltransferase B complex non catalytic subunit-domain-containing protein n=1 Tax=Microdochium trichocladiopsis TaxID=1682393 RepID=A0A9P9BRR5_9PEZI|nr:N-acetyltransferase B complex non catalytic subunit-domain-containing protein [Microdochium trichocladiopsis]KAH7027550.1 N-acetyltransferase B complex non catalytic subunit-domain-containing protein [Microdochium trichocladiopsis]
MAAAAVAAGAAPASYEIRPSPYMPNLRPTVDIKLESDWHNAQWTSVGTIAAQRYRATKDPYYLAIEIVARSWNADRLEENAGRDAVEKMVKDNVVVKDADTLDLYEYACALVPMSYPDTLGELRMRLVKAAPKDVVACQRCLDATLSNFDWVHAQQIAASMDRSFPNERKMLFRNILSTHLLTMTPACPPEKKVLFQTLTRRMIDKAFCQHFEASFDSKKPGRAISTEAEFDLWCEILLSCPKAEVLKTLFQQVVENGEKRRPLAHPISLLKTGNAPVVRRILKYLADIEAWSEVYDVCREIVASATSLNQVDGRSIAERKSEPEAVHEVHAARTAAELAVLAVGTEWSTWSLLLRASRYQPDPEAALKESLDAIESAHDALGVSKRLTRSHSAYCDLAVLHYNFAVEPQEQQQGSENTRLLALATYVINNYRSPSVYDETQAFIEMLSPAEAKQFRTILATNLEQDDVFKRFVTTALRLRVQFTIATHVAAICSACGTELSCQEYCAKCLRQIAITALQQYKVAMSNSELRDNVLPKTPVDPISDFAVIGACALLKLGDAGDGTRPGAPGISALADADVQLVLQAIVLLEAYFAALPKNDALRMMLVKLYLLIGCVSRAKTLWDSFGVKNAILDSLAPLFYDRLSTFAPHFFASTSASGGGNPTSMSPLVSYFDTALRRTYPRGLKDALDYDSYSSIAGLYGFYEKLKTSCSMVMVRTEARRGRRFNQLRNPHCIDDDPLIRNLSTRHKLSEVTDFSCLPNLGRRGSPTITEMLNLGPPQSETRTLLGLIGERFIDIISYAQPKEYKPAKPSQVLAADLLYALEKTEDLLQQLYAVVNRGSGGSSGSSSSNKPVRRVLTAAEHSYYGVLEETMTLYAALIRVCSPDHQQQQPLPEIKTSVEQTINSISDLLQDQASDALSALENNNPGQPSTTTASTLAGIIDLHALGMLRESTTLIKLAAASVSAALDKIRVVDKARAAAKDLAWIEKPLKDLKATCGAVEDKCKARVKSLAAEVGSVPWQSKVRELVLAADVAAVALGADRGDGDEVEEEEKQFRQELTALVRDCASGDARLREWAATVTQSWKELLGGWATVQYLP